MSTEEKIADFLLRESRERGELLTNLKLQKLLYYAQAWNLALRDQELFSEDFRAWVHGPVLLSQYHRFKNYRWSPIDEKIEKPDLDEAAKKHLSEIMDVFGTQSAVALELMSHREKPWIEARGDIPPDQPCSNKISKRTMAEFYRSL